MWKFIPEDEAWHLFIGLESACGLFKIKEKPKPGRKPSREHACGKCWSEWKRQEANNAAPKTDE